MRKAKEYSKGILFNPEEDHKNRAWCPTVSEFRYSGTGCRVSAAYTPHDGADIEAVGNTPAEDHSPISLLVHKYAKDILICTQGYGHHC